MSNIDFEFLITQLFKDINYGTEEEKNEFLDILKEFSSNRDILLLFKIKQHRTTNRLLHCLHVSYSCFLTCKRHNMDYKSGARAGLLHDFCLEDWRHNKIFKLRHFWGFCHPGLALKESEKRFKVNDLEKEMILKHMFPLTIVPPFHREGYIIMFWDRYWCIRELITKQEYSL